MTVYRAAPSYGSVWVAATGLLCLLLAVPGLIDPHPVARTISLAAMLPLSLLCLVMAFWVPTVRYELGPDLLLLRCGPFRYRVPLSEIESIVKRDLTMSIWSGTRWPGFAIGTVHYGNAGMMFMCSTRALKEIICIKTARRTYGITPADEEAFLQDLGRHLGE